MSMMNPDVRPRTWLGAALAAVLAACGGGPDENVVARVGEQEITAAQVAEYMQGAGYESTVEEVGKAVDELVEITLVALRAEDRHDLSPAESLQIVEWEETALLNQHREDVIWKSVAVDEAKLREWYDENVGEEVLARHILIAAPASAPDSVKQVARAKADSLLKEVKGGADFAALAEAHSDDEGSAQRGGSLDPFARGRMVEPFEQAAFNTPVGETAPAVVETQFGYHIIKVEEKRKPSFEDLREEIEEQLAMPGRQQAEQAYITRLMETSGLEFYEENVDTLIARIGADSAAGPGSETRALRLATFNGGVITLGEIWDLFEVLPEGNQRSIAQLDQADMIAALSTVVQRRLLVAEAREASTEVDSTRQRELEELARQLYAQTYLNGIVTAQMAVPDSLVRQYFDEHSEFYRGQTFEQVREQIRAILIAQRRESMSDPDAQRALVKAVADSQAADVTVERYPEHFERVLAVLRERSGQAATASR
ncbi:hypothetical protein BH18GEM1_BH18GEM1_05840 [soil metagenome]